jgi:hypothetical protein
LFCESDTSRPHFVVRFEKSDQQVLRVTRQGEEKLMTNTKARPTLTNRGWGTLRVFLFWRATHNTPTFVARFKNSSPTNSPGRPPFSATAPLNGFLHVDLPRCNDSCLFYIDCHTLSNVWEGTRAVCLLVLSSPLELPRAEINPRPGKCPSEHSAGGSFSPSPSLGARATPEAKN